MQYTIVLEEDGIELIKSVKERIADGWAPQGGVSMTADIRKTKPIAWSGGEMEFENKIIFAQSMVKD